MSWSDKDMQATKKFVICCFIFAAIILPFKTAMADAPFITDDPETMDPWTAEAILYATAEKFKVVTAIQAPAIELDFGLFRNLEADIYAPIMTNAGISPDFRGGSIGSNGTGMGDIDVELKYRFIQETPLIPQMAFAPNFFLPTGDVSLGLGNGRFWYYLPITIEKSFGDWTTYAEAGYALNSAPFMNNYTFGGWVLQKKITAKTTLGGEIFTQGTSAFDIGPYTLLNLGGAYLIDKNTRFLLSAGHNIAGEDHWIVFLGIEFS